MSWIDRIDSIVDEKHLLKHPFYTAWTRGELTLDALRGYAAQYYQHVAAFPRYLSAIHSQTPDLETRQYLLENLIDEERGAESHPELWLRFAEAIGCDRNDVRAATALPETSHCDSTFRRVARTAGPVAGLAALYAYESQVPAVAQSKIDGLKLHYGINGDGIDGADALAFFNVHLEVDERHAEIARALLEGAPEDERERAIEAATDTMQGLNTLLDGVTRAYVA